MNVKEIVEAYLKANGYDGLFNPHANCACLSNDLVSCDGNPCDCQPGYRIPCDGTCDDPPCDYHISATKPEKGAVDDLDERYDRTREEIDRHIDPNRPQPEPERGAKP